MNNEDPSTCPFCGKINNCEHLLLLVDKTFRNADGGILRKSFNNRWSEICDENGEDFDEREFFDVLLEEVESISDAIVDFECDEIPGMSSDNVIFFVKDEESLRKALESFDN